MARIFEDITKTVGNTPLVRINRLAGDSMATVLVKLESFNPVSCIKERIGVAMVEAAEKEGLLTEGGVIIERPAAIPVSALPLWQQSGAIVLF